MSDSLAERVLRLYVQGEPLDGELLELAQIAIADSRAIAGELAREAGAYLRESADLVEEIVSERGSDP